MGFILSKIWGRESTSQKIEKIQNKIVSIQDFKRDTKAKQNRITKRLNISFAILYALAVIFGLIYAKFYYHNPHKNMDFIFKFKIFLGFGLAPIMFVFLKRSLSWLFTRRLNKNEVKLKELREKKSKILDEVTEKETFKVAREILEKYAPESLAKYGMVSGYGMSSGSASISSSFSGRSSYSSDSSSSLRHRIVPGSSKSVLSTTSPSATSSSSTFSSRISSSGTSNSASAHSSRSSMQPSRIGSDVRAPLHQPRPMSAYGPSRPRAPGPRPLMRPMAPPNIMPMGPPLPRPVVPVQKGFLGKIVDYVVGEGPGTRYALICNQCQSHNGMAQEEVYEYTSYRCCYCHYWNPPKKNRPMAPKLVLPSPELTKKEDDEKVEEVESKKENSKSTNESIEESSSLKEAPLNLEDSNQELYSSKNMQSENESIKSKKTELLNEASAVLKESSNVSNLDTLDKEEKISDHKVQEESKLEVQEAEEENCSEPKSDSESDIDIIDKEEALEVMEIDERNKSNLGIYEEEPKLNKEE